jgi:hypothetical protein
MLPWTGVGRLASLSVTDYVNINGTIDLSGYKGMREITSSFSSGAWDFQHWLFGRITTSQVLASFEFQMGRGHLAQRLVKSEVGALCSGSDPRSITSLNTYGPRT